MVFLFGRKMIISVLLVFKLILFDLSHFDKNDRSWLMCLLIFFKDLFEYKRFVSSANRCTSLFLIALWRSLINIKNSKGPKTDPWGTPIGNKGVGQNVAIPRYYLTHEKYRDIIINQSINKHLTCTNS